mgnify:FL=1
MLRTVKIEDSNVNITLPYGELVALMNDCVKTTMKLVGEEEKAKENKIWYSTAEAAKKCSVGTSTINRWKHKGYLPANTIGGRDYYSEEDIKKILAA